MRGISRRSFLAAMFSLAASRYVAKAATSDLTFLAMGDWGKGSTDQRKVAVQMAKTAEAIRAHFVISTGDNFYPHGVQSVNDPQWVTTFEDVYDAPALMIPWYVVLGNHDHGNHDQCGTVSAQVDYTRLSSRWYLPATYYKHTKLLTDGSRADFFHLDTTPIIGQQFLEDPQLAWLARELAASTAAWRIVIGHHPLYSGGSHGGSKELLTRLKPLLEQYAVQAYLNGHDHIMQHVAVGRTHYLTSGTGSNARSARPTEGTGFVMGHQLGFMTARLTPAVMNIEFIDEQGTSLYRASIPRSDLL
jgi:tartrate-resistant acid phosphatase type 5